MYKTIGISELYKSFRPKSGNNTQIKETAEHIGITSQGLHWYESKGLISPQKLNSYRSFTLDDLCLLSRIRFYRQVGFSTKAIDELLDMDIDSIASTLDERIVEMRGALEKEQVKILVLEERARLTREFSELEGVLTQVDTEAFFFKHSYRVNQRIAEDPASTIKDWVSDIPLCQYISVDTFNDSFDKRERGVGLALPLKYAVYANEVVQKEIRQGGIPLIKSEKALYSVFQTSDVASVDPFEVMGDLLEEESHKLEGTMIWRPIVCRRSNDKVITYWEMWLPLKRKD